MVINFPVLFNCVITSPSIKQQIIMREILKKRTTYYALECFYQINN